MQSSINFTVLAAARAVVGTAFAASDVPHNPYAGQEERAIKALSEQEVSGLLAGNGAGLAKAAELNGYPGPAHVLELADALHLDTARLDATQQLMAAHRRRAGELGAELVASEQALDALFAEKRADAALIGSATQRVGALQAKVRVEHLTTHLTQTALSSTAQLRRYGELRGYTQAPSDALPTGSNPPAAEHHRHITNKELP